MNLLILWCDVKAKSFVNGVWYPSHTGFESKAFCRLCGHHFSCGWGSDFVKKILSILPSDFLSLEKLTHTKNSWVTSILEWYYLVFKEAVLEKLVKISVLVNSIIQELKFCKIAQLFFFVSVPLVREKSKVSVQGVKSLGGHFACLCRGFEFHEVKKKLLLFFKKKMEILLHF